MHKYSIRVTDSTLRNWLLNGSLPAAWIITANDLPSAWRKFCIQRFGALKPDPANYDIRLA